jgi:hypothetical protein
MHKYCVRPSPILFSETGKFQVRALLCAGLCLFSVLVETSAASYLLPAAECELDLSLKEKGLLGSAVFIGKIANIGKSSCTLSHEWFAS